MYPRDSIDWDYTPVRDPLPAAPTVTREMDEWADVVTAVPASAALQRVGLAAAPMSRLVPAAA